ncbi:unnamed protein product [Heterobilharzia americana]|nr:unnamed protein product [Heterobilharzia americana]
MLHTDILVLVFLCFIVILIAIGYFVFHSDAETNIMKRRKRIRTMSKQLNNKNARHEIARFYSFDKQAQHKMNSFSSEFDLDNGVDTADFHSGDDQSKRDFFGNTSCKARKESLIPYHKQQRHSLQPISMQHSYENEHTPFSQNQGIRFICGLQTPPINITKPQTVQPDSRPVTQRKGLTRAFSESCTTKLVNPNNNTIHPVNTETNETRGDIRLPKLSEPNLQRHIHPWLNRLKYNTSIFYTDKSASSSSESMWSEAKRRLSNADKVFDPVMRILSTVPLKNQTNVDTSWMNFTMNPNTNGNICFSLAYTCTLSTLNVTINRLIGVSNLIKSSDTLPSQTSTNFIVSLRLRHHRKLSIYRECEDEAEIRKLDLREESDGFRKKYFTQPVSTSLNPNFDQSFMFPITLNELKNAELVLTVLQSTTMNKSIDGNVSLEDSLIPRRNISMTSYHSLNVHSGDKCSRRVNMISEDMRCIGVTFYKLNQHELINCPEKMQNIWQELRKLPELHDGQLEMNMDNTNPTTTTTDNNSDNGYNNGVPIASISSPLDYETFVYNSENEEQNMNEMENEKSWASAITRVPRGEPSNKSMAKVSILYKRESSILEISVEEFRNLKMYTNETEMMFQALFCLGNTTLSVVKGKPFKIAKLKSDEANIHEKQKFNTFNQISIPYTEHLSLNVDMNRLLNFTNIGVLLQIFVRTDLSSHLRRLANISVGETKVTHDLSLVQWNDLIKELKRLKNDNLFTATRKITYWHLIDAV